ncbi:hypothetical protein [Neobacillus massiliamazoniensis]|uniref:Putative membrane protein yszA n=1 Tax=Neobacillus massiliamazoniensis TaxID=1499688 RepID=A0A0U1P2H8_9BACI|nr:hypothetical protein [Neobacillus massiliamazoniensis]CRK84312.1 putative membrane protein yszA [Neobacillus massiliamazoniensis]
MKRSFHRFKYQPWFIGFRRICGQFIVPIIIFQGIRTILIPTVFDIFLLAFLLMIGMMIFLKII